MVTMTVTDFLTKEKTVWDAKRIVELEEYKHMGHGGGDWRLMRDFVTAVSLQDPSYLVSTVEESLASHLIGFKAEESRAKGHSVRM
jgi:hypothetical protein